MVNVPVECDMFVVFQWGNCGSYRRDHLHLYHSIGWSDCCRFNHLFEKA